MGVRTKTIAHALNRPKAVDDTVEQLTSISNCRERVLQELRDAIDNGKLLAEGFDLFVFVAVWEQVFDLGHGDL